LSTSLACAVGLWRDDLDERRDNQDEKGLSWRGRKAEFDCRRQGQCLGLIVGARQLLDALIVAEVGGRSCL